MACISNAVSTHLTTHHPQLDQPDLITGNFEFLGRSVIGPADISITVLKTGRQFSTIRAQLLQGKTKSGQPAIAIEAHLTQGNLSKEAQNGLLSLPTRPIYVQGLPRRENSRISVDPWAERRPAAHKIEMWVQQDVDGNDVRPSLGPSVREQWARWRGSNGDGAGFDNVALSFLADTFRPVPEQYGLVGNWYPTVNARLDVKKKEPAGGWQWVFMSVEMKMVRNGRFDYEVLIFDEGEELIAVSHHTGLVVGAERNSKVKGTESKI